MQARNDYIAVKSATRDDYDYPATHRVKTLYRYTGTDGEAPFYVCRETSVYDTNDIGDMNDNTEILSRGSVDSWEFDTLEAAEQRFDNCF